MTQKTKNPQTGEPMHMETGYINFRPNGIVTMTACDPTGVHNGIVVEGFVHRGCRFIAQLDLMALTSIIRGSSESDIHDPVCDRMSGLAHVYEGRVERDGGGSTTITLETSAVARVSWAKEVCATVQQLARGNGWFVSHRM
jgi:hypothetical protein